MSPDTKTPRPLTSSVGDAIATFSSADPAGAGPPCAAHPWERAANGRCPLCQVNGGRVRQLRGGRHVEGPAVRRYEPPRRRRADDDAPRRVRPRVVDERAPVDCVIRRRA